MSEREAGNLIQDIWREDTMWERQGHAELDEDQRAAEAGVRRLAALEKQLRDEEEESRKEKARLRAEELKKRRKESGSVTSNQAKETVTGFTGESISLVHGEATQIYMEVLLLAYRDGKPEKAQEDVLVSVRKRLGITDEEHARIEQRVRMEIYSQAIVGVWQHGVGTTRDFDRLDVLRDELRISADDHMRLEREARRHALLAMATKRPS